MQNVSDVYENMPELKAKRFWHPEEVRMACIRHDFYRRGNTMEYERMLTSVRNFEPTIDNIYLVAKDIFEHSNNEEITIASIMYILEDEAVHTTFKINGREDV